MQYHSPYYYVYAVGTVAVIFAVCAILDFLRILLFEKPYERMADRVKKWIVKRG